MFVWLLAGLFTGWKQYSLSDVQSHINNFTIFRSSFGHFMQHLPLYSLYPKEYFDLYLYGPIFALCMAPFAWIPVWMSVVLWNVLNACMLCWAVWNLPCTQTQRSGILWIILNSTITALLNTQFHALCVALILWSYIFLHRGKIAWAVFLISLGILIKFYGVIGLAFFFFTKERVKFIFYGLASLGILLVIPLLLGGYAYGMQCYEEWFAVLGHKNDLNVDIRNIRTDVCVMGMFRRITGDGSLSNLWFILPSMLFSAWVYFRPKLWFQIDFQMRILAMMLIYLMLASTGTESPTLIMAFPGVGIWFVLSRRTRWDWALLIFTLVVASFSPTDLFPAYVRMHLINPYGLMILPLVMVWMVLGIRPQSTV